MDNLIQLNLQSYNAFHFDYKIWFDLQKFE
jgi:hypothetical protein